MLTTEAAITKVINAWGVGDRDRLEAIRMILNGVNPDEVVAAVQGIANQLGLLESLKPQR